MVAIYIVIGLVAGVIITFLIMMLNFSKISSAKALAESLLKNELRQISKDRDLLQLNIESLESEKQEALSKLNALETENKNLGIENSRLSTQLELSEKALIELKENFNQERERLNTEREKAEQNAEQLRKESDAQWQLKFDKLKEEFQNMASQLLTTKQELLQENNKSQIGELLKPISQQFEAFRKSVEESKTSNEVAKKELKDSFEATMKLFAQQQDLAVDALKRETLKIGNDANNLTQALKRDTKKQGNWGELILETILENSGLEKGVHFLIQENVKDDDGKNYRPDVIVKFPEGRSVIIDSKVSLTAYTEAFETLDEDTRRRRLKDHARSVRKHVDELSDKKYDNLVSDAIGFVLMFIPNDQCYLAALEEDTDLSRYAYSKGIVIISPSNLMMALQLAYNMWQQDVRNRNIDNIVKTAADLYDKVANFEESMESVERNISQLNICFQNAKNQLYTGKGNIMGRITKLKKFGITPKKQIKGVEEIDPEDQSKD